MLRWSGEITYDMSLNCLQNLHSKFVTLKKKIQPLNVLDYNGWSRNDKVSAYFKKFCCCSRMGIWFLLFFIFFVFRNCILFRAFVSNWRCVYDAQANPHIIKYQNREQMQFFICTKRHVLFGCDETRLLYKTFFYRSADLHRVEIVSFKMCYDIFILWRRWDLLPIFGWFFFAVFFCTIFIINQLLFYFLFLILCKFFFSKDFEHLYPISYKYTNFNSYFWLTIEGMTELRTPKFFFSYICRL